MKITVHIPTEDERRADEANRLVRTNTEQLEVLADRMNRNLTRELYGSTEGSIEITVTKSQ